MKKIFIYSLLILFLSGCSSVKRVKDSDYLLTQNTIVVNDKKSNNTALIELLVQKPNSKTFSIILNLIQYERPLGIEAFFILVIRKPSGFFYMLAQHPFDLTIRGPELLFGKSFDGF